MVENSNLRVFGAVGSPRRGGNTETLVDEVLAGAKEAGASIEKVILNELNIKPCQACNSCYKTGLCVQDDDMAELEEKMQQSQIWVLSTPIYWWGPTSQFKSFLDRWYGLRKVKYKGKRVILVIALGGGNEKYARHTVGMLTDVLDYLKMELFATVIATGVNRYGAVRKKSNILEKAHNTGRDAIEKSIKNL